MTSFLCSLSCSRLSIKSLISWSHITLTIRAIIVLTNQHKSALCDNFSLYMFWGRNYEQREQQCFSPILVNDLKSNVILRNILHCIDYATITMFTMSRRKHCVYSFCTKISAFSSPTNRTIKSPKSQTQKYNPFTYIQPRL